MKKKAIDGMPIDLKDRISAASGGVLDINRLVSGQNTTAKTMGSALGHHIPKRGTSLIDKLQPTDSPKKAIGGFKFGLN